MKKRGIIIKITSVLAAACFFAPRFLLFPKFDLASENDSAACFLMTEKAKKDERQVNFEKTQKNEKTQEKQGSFAKNAKSVKSEKGEFIKKQLVIKTPRGEYRFFYPQLSFVYGELTLLGIDAEVERIYCDNYVPAENAELLFTPNAQKCFNILPEKRGKVIKKQKIKSAICYALSRGELKIELFFEPTEPKIKSAELEKKCLSRSFFSTYYGASSKERKNNIELAAKAINGTVLPCGGEFSFNKVVGERTEERGYLPAKIISGGEFVDGVGGGVCQVSSTIYNAALLAGLSVTEWHRHSLPISYVSPSFDAMVSGNFCDLVFKNDTDSEIYIVCRADGEYVSAEFFGIKKEYDYKLISRVLETIEPEIKSEYDKTLKSGEKKQVVYAKKGFKSEGYLCAYRGEKLIFSKKIRSDEYPAVNGLIKTGDK